jgi:NADH-quinone oxidoreductase subunit J
LEGLGFYAFGALALLGALLMVTSRNPLHGVLWLVVSFLGLSGLFGALGADFLAAVQVLVYAGAILVLFLFVVMLLHLRPEDLSKMPAFSVRGGWGGMVLGVGGFAVLVGWVVLGSTAFADRGVAEFKPLGGGAADLAVPLFQDGLLPFEAVSILLLAAIVGSVALTKRRLP